MSYATLFENCAEKLLMQELYKEKIFNAFPKNVHKDVEQVIIFLSDNKFEIHSQVNQDVTINGEKLIIPG
ncbi:MAG: hypothetical protein WBP45_04060, partial [Daejeonella sp.]